jgi:hypothetical protein
MKVGKSALVLLVALLMIGLSAAKSPLVNGLTVPPLVEVVFSRDQEVFH